MDADQEVPSSNTVDLNKNYATDEATEQWVMTELCPLIPHVMMQRQPLEEEWREVRRAALLIFDANRKYLGRSQTFVPLWAKALDTLTAQTSNGLFPLSDTTETIKVADKLVGDKSRSQSVTDYLNYEFTKSANVRRNMQGGIRHFWEYGHGVFKIWYAKELAKLGKKEFRRTSFDPIAEMAPDMFRSADSEGLRVSSRNPFFVYVWPFTADSVEEANLVFETINVPFKFIEQMVRSGRWPKDRAEMVKGGVNIQPTHEQNIMQNLLEQIGNPTSPTTGAQPGSELTQLRTVTECWLDVPLPASAYTGDESPGYPVPCRVVVAGNTVLEVRRNPFFHQKPPYLFLRARPEGGSFYGKGNGFYAKQLQYLFNDLTNQVNDNGTFALNPVAFMNINLLAGPPTPIKPGAVYSVLGPDAIKFDRPPIEQIQHAMTLLSFFQSLLNDVAGTPPIMQGTNAGKGARTATSSQILQRNASQPLQTVIQDIEGDVMRPMMRWCWLLGQQYRRSPVLSHIAGRDIKVTPEDLLGDFEFDWLASTQVVNAQARASQASQFLQAIANPVLVQLLAQQGKTLNPEPVLRRLWVDGMGYRNFDEIVTAMPPAPMMGQPGAGGPQQPGALGPGSGDTSAIAGSPDMVAGEGEDYSAVRQGSDQMSAQMGGEL